jgi:hypothetical protein
MVKYTNYIDYEIVVVVVVVVAVVVASKKIIITTTLRRLAYCRRLITIVSPRTNYKKNSFLE